MCRDYTYCTRECEHMDCIHNVRKGEMNVINISGKFCIDADENQFILKEKGTVQDKTSKNYGEETQTTLGYFSTVEQAILCLEKILLRRSIKIKDYTLKEAVEEIRAIHEDVFKCMKEELK